LTPNTNIHANQGHGHDEKYSEWRRSTLPDLVKRRDCYCTDIDWLEWRKGKPVAIIECKRAMSKQTGKTAIQNLKTLTNGFQIEVLVTCGHKIGIPVYLVGILDGDKQEAKKYKNSKFYVEEAIPPNPWPQKLNVKKDITYKLIGEFSEQEYADFLAQL
jgi:hypothetical protein